MNRKEHPNTEFIKAYDEWGDDIFRFVFLKTKNRDTALDLTQETFIKVWEYIEAGNAIGHMRGLLYQIARNLVIDTYRKKTTVSLESLSESGFDPIAPEDQSFDDFEIKEAMAIIDELDAKYRDPILLRYVEELSVQEIADILDEAENTISVRIHRGIEKIRAQITTEN